MLHFFSNREKSGNFEKDVCGSIVIELVFFFRLHDHQNLDVLEIPQLICMSGENYRCPSLTMTTKLVYWFKG